MDEFCKKLACECEKNLSLEDKTGSRRNRKGRLSESEIMTILVCYHFGSFANFKHYYLFYIRQHLAGYFPDAVSYNRFVELMPRVFLHMMLFMKLQAFGKCGGISFVDSTMIPVCHNLRRYANKVFNGIAKNGKGTMGWCHGFKLHLLYNDRGDIITFCLTGANVDDRDKRVWSVFAKELYGKVFADRGYIKQELFEDLFSRGIHLVHGLKANMKNRLMSMWDKTIEMSCLDLSRAFLAFADHRRPFSYGDVWLTSSQVKRVNALMQTCGCYDEAGEFSFLVGLPGKSGVGGEASPPCARNATP